MAEASISIDLGLLNPVFIKADVGQSPEVICQELHQIKSLQPSLLKLVGEAQPFHLPQETFTGRRFIYLTQSRFQNYQLEIVFDATLPPLGGERSYQEVRSEADNLCNSMVSVITRLLQQVSVQISPSEF